MSFLDTLIYGVKTILSGGVAVTQRSKLNFVSGATVADNAATGSTDVTIAAGGTSPTFKTSIILRNPADTFSYIFTPAAIAANRILNVPLMTGTDTMALLDLAQAMTNKTLVAASNTITDTSAVVGDVLYHNGTKFLRASAPIDPGVSGFRLSLTTAVPVTTADVATATSVFLVPYTSGSISLYNGTTWIAKRSAEVSLALGTLTSGKNYDVFAYDNAGTLTLELSAAWTNDTTRSSAVTTQDGVLCKSGALTRRLVGTIRMISTTQTTDTLLQRYCWNANNRVSRRLAVADATASWTYVNPNSVWRQVRATAANRVECVSGDPQQYVSMRASGAAFASAAGFAAVGIGINSTTTNSAYGVGVSAESATITRNCAADYGGFLALGYNAINWLETGTSGAVTYTFTGVANVSGYGMVGEVQA